MVGCVGVAWGVGALLPVCGCGVFVLYLAAVIIAVRPGWVMAVEEMHTGQHQFCLHSIDLYLRSAHLMW